MEVLGQLIAPDKARKLIETALHDIGWAEIPHGRTRFEILVRQGVAPRITEMLGSAEAELILEELLRIAQMMPDDAYQPGQASGRQPRSGQRPTPIPDAPAPDADRRSRATLPAPSDAVVAFATASTARLERIESRLVGKARVRGIHDAISLFDVLQAEHVVLLLVDLRQPALRWPTLLALAEDIPAHAKVVVCGDESLRDDVESRSWTFVSDEAGLDATVDQISET